MLTNATDLCTRASAVPATMATTTTPLNNQRAISPENSLHAPDGGRRRGTMHGGVGVGGVSGAGGGGGGNRITLSRQNSLCSANSQQGLSRENSVNSQSAVTASRGVTGAPTVTSSSPSQVASTLPPHDEYKHNNLSASSCYDDKEAQSTGCSGDDREAEASNGGGVDVDPVRFCFVVCRFSVLCVSF